MRMIAALALLMCGCAQQPERGGVPLTIGIDSEPSRAWIFVDGDYAGTTPLTHEITLRPDRRYVEIAAVPEDGSLVRQVLRLAPPTLPGQVTFFLDNPDPRAVSR